MIRQREINNVCLDGDAGWQCGCSPQERQIPMWEIRLPLMDESIWSFLFEKNVYKQRIYQQYPPKRTTPPYLFRPAIARHSLPPLPSRCLFPLFPKMAYILFRLKPFIIIPIEASINMSSSATLSDRLLLLRGLIADRADTPTLLLETDKLIGLEKHLRGQRMEAGGDALRQEKKALAQKVKQVEKEKREKEGMIGNLQRDLEMMRIKCRNLEERLQQQNVTAARERRKEARVERRNTAEYEIQVETLSPVVLENLVRNYRSELNENEKLRVELRELKQLMENPEESEEDGLSVGSTCGESEVDTEVEMETTQGASFSEGEGETPRQQDECVVTVGQRQSAFGLICSVSRLVLGYFQNQ